MAAFRRRPITIGNARPTGLAGIILDEYRANDIPPGKGNRSARPHASLAVKNSDKDYNSATRHFVSDLSLHHLERIKRRGMNFLNKISEKILSRREN